jgi:hypothetical protein
MAVTIEEFRAYIGTDEDSTFVSECLTAGHALVTKFVGDATVPVTVHDNAILMASSELFYRRQSPQGVTQFAAMDGNPIRAAKDPMNAARELLRPYTSYGC